MATTQMSIGDLVPSFELPDTDGALHAAPLDDAPPATVVIVTRNHCPYVIAWNPRLKQAALDYPQVRFLGVNANDATRFPADGPDRMKQFVADQDWPFPYLRDESQEVAAALGAQVTPHVFVFDGEQRLVYRGAPDSDHQDPSRNAEWLRGALDAVLAGEPVAEPQRHARGCSVKWR